MASTIDLLSSDDSISEDGADTVSLDGESVSAATITRETASQGSDAEASERTTSGASSERRRQKRTISLTVPSIAASSRHSNPWQFPNTEAGYFVLPDPLPSGVGAATTPVTTGSSGENKQIVEDDVATELCGSPRSKSVRSVKNIQPESTGTTEKAQKQFLPLVEDDSNHPRRSSLDEKLAKINKRVAGAQIDQKKTPVQPNAEIPLPGIHPAFQHEDLHAVSQDQQSIALRAEVEALAKDLRAMKRSTTSSEHRLSEEVKRLHKNQDRLLKGWEHVRDELLEMKVAHEQLKQYMNAKAGSSGLPMPLNRPSGSSAGSLRPPTTSSTSDIGEHASKDTMKLHTPTRDDSHESVFDTYHRNRNPPTNVMSNTLSREERQARKRQMMANEPSFPRARVKVHTLPLPGYHVEHVHRYPQGCSWQSCPICRGVGDGNYS